MYQRDYIDIIGGLALIAFGLFCAVNAIATLRLGTYAQMGPGMFPAALGFVLAVIGAAIMAPAFRREGEELAFELRPFVMILISVLVFGIMIRPFGLIPSIVALTLVASRADGKLSLGWALALAALLSVLTTLIFSIGLGLQISIFNWPW